MKDKDEEYTPRNYVNTWLTDTLKSRIYGKFQGSDAKPVRVQWDVDKSIVRADILSTSNGAGTALFNVPVRSINEARFEGNIFSLTVHGKRYRFIIANDELNKEIDIAIGDTEMRIMNSVEDILLDPAIDDLKILRRMLEAHNVKVVGVRIVRSVLVGFGVTFIILAILYLALSAYVNSQAK